MPKRGSAQGGGNKKKRSKTYHCSKETSSPSNKGSFMIQPDMAGVMVMCARGREKKAVKEAIDILSQYADKLFPESKEEEKEGEEEGDDLEASIAKELESLKKHDKKRKRFAHIPTGIDCVMFLRTIPPVEPVKLVHDMLTDLDVKQLKTTRYISRFLPVEKICHSHLPDMEKAAQSLFSTSPFFNEKDENGNTISKKFALVCRVRNCNKLVRLDVINAIAGVVDKVHQVDLTNPEITVLIEVCQVCYLCSIMITL
ncbi:hypothetical protein BDB01DRAFT_714404 [Pilobolus umbonatus]|nr:hypothetical protein BDB01DRAFT_714404 [Pilobolus umbonatus]